MGKFPEKQGDFPLMAKTESEIVLIFSEMPLTKNAEFAKIESVFGI